MGQLLRSDILQALRTPAGQRLLERAAGLAGDPFAAQKLRDEASPEMAAAAVEQVRLRARAAARFSHPERMWFSPGLLEQASGEAAAQHHARRFEPWRERWIGDFCCGLGADTAALAAVGKVAALDRDPLALALTAANAEAAGVRHRVRLVCGELPTAAPAVSVAWVDPGRREAGRTRGLAAISPTLAEVLSLRERIKHLGIKLSPATAEGELDAVMEGLRHERELVSVNGECRELIVWTGDLARNAAGQERLHRATLLPQHAELSGAPVPLGAPRPLAGWLLEPDPAVIRSGLVGNLAEQLGAWPIDERLAYLATSSPVETPFARTYRVDAPEPFSGKKLAARLRQLGAGDVVVKTRGSVLQPEAVRRELRGVLKQGRADCRPVVFLTRLNSRPVMILGERIGPGRS